MADIITRAGKGSNLTPTEVDSNFKNLNAAVLAIQGVYGTGTVTSVAVTSSLGPVIDIYVSGDPTINPNILFQVSGGSGYVKSSGTGGALSVSAAIPFTDTTGTVPINRGGTNLTSLGANFTLLGSNGSSLVYRTLSSTDSSIVFDWATSGVLKMVVDPSVININNLSGTLGIAKGGTGQTTASAAINALLPSQTGYSGRVLSTDGLGGLSWIAAGGTGTVTSVAVSSSGVSSVLSFSIGDVPTINPTLVIGVTGTAGYLKSTGSALSSVPVQTAINELTNVSTATENDFLFKNSSGNAAWSSSLYVKAGTATGVAYLGSSKELKTNTANFYYDDTVNYNILYVGQQVETRQRFVSATGSVNAYDFFIGINSASTGTLTLPDSATLPVGKRFIFKDITGNMTSRNWTIDGNGTTIDGGATTNMNSNHQCIEIILMQNGAKSWSIKSHYKTA